MNNITKDVANQLYSIIKLLPKEKQIKIPPKINEILNEKISNEKLSITDVSQIGEENLLEDTKKYLAYIFFYYLSDEDEKKEFKNILNLNEEKYQDYLNKKYDVSNIFGNKNEFTKQTIKQEELIIVEEKKWWQKIIEKLKSLIIRK